MAWKKLAFYDEVATISSYTPKPADGTGAASGSNTDASRDDHVHALGPLIAAWNINQNQMDGMVLEKATTAPDSGSEAEAQIYYNSNTTDQHLYVWIP